MCILKKINLLTSIKSGFSLINSISLQTWLSAGCLLPCGFGVAGGSGPGAVPSAQYNLQDHIEDLSPESNFWINYS